MADLEKTIQKLDDGKDIGFEPNQEGIDSDSSNQSNRLTTEVILTEKVKSEIKGLFKEDFDNSVQAQKDEIKKEGQEIKKDFLTIFGLFASFVTFLSIEVQVFKNKENILELIGICSISLSFVMFFALIINDIAKDKSQWSDFKKPTYIFNLLFLIVGITFLYLGGKSSITRIDKIEKQNKSDSTEMFFLNQKVQKMNDKIYILDSLNKVLIKKLGLSGSASSR
ncbi:hypothetical protein [Runella limosa]|uniref:hypothetical protein n=1 Tax=Runella limosa TaxID=370978 RepID=UPI0004073E6F|nr:hypothetical protein [Runella limosa]